MRLTYFNTLTNFGDALSPWIVTRLVKGPVTAYDCLSEPPLPHLIAVGSILQWANEQSFVWGAGLISENARPVRPPASLCAVRGPLSREILLKTGLDVPPIYGDPGLLLPTFHHPDVEVTHELGIVPHYVDRDHAFVEKCRESNVRVIDVFEDVEKCVAAIRSCARIASSSLHGLICAEAYGIPTCWLELTGRVLGRGFKFRDYYASLGLTHQRPLSVGSQTSVLDVAQSCSHKEIALDLSRLVRSFPSHLDTFPT